MTQQLRLGLQLVDRQARYDNSPGAWTTAADLIELSLREAERWTRRCDDAKRIPDMLWEACQDLRARAKDCLAEFSQRSVSPLKLAQRRIHLLGHDHYQLNEVGILAAEVLRLTTELAEANHTTELYESEVAGLQRELDLEYGRDEN